jgi:hypothetical protein
MRANNLLVAYYSRLARLLPVACCLLLISCCLLLISCPPAAQLIVNH